MSSRSVVRDHGSSEDGGEFQGTVAAEQAPGRTFQYKAHSRAAHRQLQCCTAAFSIFWEPQALFVNLEQVMSCCNDLISHLSLDSDREFPWA